MANTVIDERPVWRKLLDPIRDDYAADIESDEMLLLQAVYDLQWFTKEHMRLSRITQKQARLLRREGIGGY